MASVIQEPVPRETNAGFEGTLANIAERIREQEGQRQKVAEALAGLRDVTLEGVEEVIEHSLVKPVEQDALTNLTVAGVDGGMLERRLSRYFTTAKLGWSGLSTSQARCRSPA